MRAFFALGHVDAAACHIAGCWGFPGGFIRACLLVKGVAAAF